MDPPPVDIIPAEDLAALKADMHLLGAVVGSGADRWMVPPILNRADGRKALDKRLIGCWLHLGRPTVVESPGMMRDASNWAGLPPKTPNADHTVASIVGVLGDLANDLGVAMWPADDTPLTG